MLENDEDFQVQLLLFYPIFWVEVFQLSDPLLSSMDPGVSTCAKAQRHQLSFIIESDAKKLVETRVGQENDMQGDVRLAILNDEETPV